MKLKDCLVTLLALTVSTTAMAFTNDPNVFEDGNLWSITFHNDDSTGHTQWATQRICFLPYTSPAASTTQLKGRWYSTSYPNWHGHYRQEGDSVKMVGNFWGGKGNDSMSWDIVTSNSHTGLGHTHRTIGAGHWSEWGDNGRFGPVYGFGNALFQRVGKCRHTLQLQQRQTGKSVELSARVPRRVELDFDSLNIRPRILQDGSEATHPMQNGQLPLEDTNELEVLFQQ